MGNTPRSRHSAPHHPKRLSFQDDLAHDLNPQGSGEESGNYLHPAGVELHGDQCPVQGENEPVDQMQDCADLREPQGQAANQQGKADNMIISMIVSTAGSRPKTCRGMPTPSEEVIPTATTTAISTPSMTEDSTRPTTPPRRTVPFIGNPTTNISYGLDTCAST